jgi:hypothetical protein
MIEQARTRPLLDEHTLQLVFAAMALSTPIKATILYNVITTAKNGTPISEEDQEEFNEVAKEMQRRFKLVL